MPNSLKEQGFTHLLAVLAVGVFTLLLISSVIPVTRQYNDGKSNVAGVYLAKEGGSGGSGDSSGGSSGDSGSHDSGGSSSGSSGSSSDSSGSSGSSGGSSGSGSSGSSSGNSGSTQTTTTTSESKSKSNEIKKEIEKREVETKEVKDSQRAEVKTTSEKIKSEIRQGNLRIKFEIENGKVKIETKVKEAENETELENEAENEAVKEVEAELEKADIKIATAPGQIALVNKKAGALSNFPLSVNPTTRELTVTSPAGSKVVAVLPQTAIDNMLATHIMDDVLSEKVNNNLASVPELVKLEIKNGVLGYEVRGTKTHKLLGVISIKTEVEAFVSAENGQVVESSQSLLGRILNRIAP